MKLTFITELGQSYYLEVSSDLPLQVVQSLLESESGIPVSEQFLTLNGKILDAVNDSDLQSLGIQDDAIFELKRKVTFGGRDIPQDTEMIRLQALGDPSIMSQIRQSNPALAEAAVSNPRKFGQMLRDLTSRMSEMQQIPESSDPYNVDHQKKIEEQIRQQRIMENLEHAMEHSPESFGRVNMLYVNTEVNGHKVKAFVDSGAQSTIMSPSCAERCGIMRLCDTRFSGTAVGVGTAKILGRVHSAQLKIGKLYLACSFTIMDGKGVELLFGLDMLKRHQACIDLKTSTLLIQDESVPFLAEHDIPQNMLSTPADDEIDREQASPHQSNISSASRSQLSNPLNMKDSKDSQPQSAPSDSNSEQSIQALINLGASRQEAIDMLKLTDGNVDLAASMMF